MRILVVEDEADIRRLAEMSLTRGGDWKVILATDGEECLVIAQQEQPDVILLDYIMPKLDGFQTCQRLKADPATRDIPVIFLSASVQDHERERGLALGAIGYLAKPFNPLELPRQVEDLLARSDPSSTVPS